MPLLKIDLYEGRTDAELKVLLDAVHRGMLACGVAATDVMVNMVTCQDEDWSFGLGRAQFLISSDRDDACRVGVGLQRTSSTRNR